MAVAFDRLPIVDIGALRGNDAAAKARTAEKLAAAARDVGFLYVTGHGIPRDVIEGLEAAAEAFFDLPIEQKQAYHIRNSTCHRGYVPVGEEGFYAANPEMVDLKEAFDTGLDLPADDPDYVAGNRMLGPNIWPAELPGFAAKVTAYYTAATRLGRTLFHGFALALGLEEDFFDRHLTKPPSQLRLLYYPRSDVAAHSTGWGIGPHTDFECFTILHSTKPGLQVQNAAGDWIEAPPIPGAFVVNIGDMLQAWSNGSFVATGHRVAKTGERRFSFPLFCAVDYWTEVRPLPSLCTAERPAQFPPLIAGEHLVAQTIRAFTYLRTQLEAGTISLPDSAPPEGTFGHETLQDARVVA
jgi:isopenicillin N synthase-like dioxygenase